MRLRRVAQTSLMPGKRVQRCHVAAAAAAQHPNPALQSCGWQWDVGNATQRTTCKAGTAAGMSIQGQCSPMEATFTSATALSACNKVGPQPACHCRRFTMDSVVGARARRQLPAAAAHALCVTHPPRTNWTRSPGGQLPRCLAPLHALAFSPASHPWLT